MRLNKLLAAAGTLAATVTTAMAQTVERAAPAVEGQSEMFGGSSLLTIALIVALGIGIFLLVDDDNGPDSP